ncbi:hypothetical protein GCK72_009056 [Caenorhabditis remanei]|uniref:Uncharacterized protein n=1 Tax=Caenorhabditis remanei TaxID=31234 RepID=A0A6A5H1W6_CAERE|nr:hypothetical protein GCK72_009056 [Caenorhabditis remanei]KAF1760806.1 hypothetical protein GCK72_009056 [Caenorhabditis remanei]
MGHLQIPEKMQFSITLAIQGYLAGHPSVDFISRRTKQKVLMVLLCILAFFTLCNFITIFVSPPELHATTEECTVSAIAYSVFFYSWTRLEIRRG